MSAERHVALTHGDLSDLSEALSWVVQQDDGELAGADMIKVEMEQIMRSSDIDEPGPMRWESVWVASVRGVFPLVVPEEVSSP